VPPLGGSEAGEGINGVFGPRISPDGNLLVFWSNDPQGRSVASGYNGSVWVADLARGTLSPLPQDSMQNFWTVWTPDGRSIVSTGGNFSGRMSSGLYVRRIERSGGPLRLTNPGDSAWQQPYSFTADGSLLLFHQSRLGVNHDIRALPWEEGAEPWTVLATPAEEYHPAISPDGRWLAYVSNESGRPEVYLSDFPGVEARRLVSAGGGSSPVWAGGGREIVYRMPVEAAVAMMSVRVEPAGDDLTLGPPHELFRGPYVEAWLPFGRFYDVADDGQRFIMARNTQPGRSLERVTVVLNWLDELKSRFRE
jgi:Tol biopolymer transport system component